MNDVAPSAWPYHCLYSDVPPSPSNSRASWRRVLVLSEAGSHLTECMWAAVAIAARRLAQTDVGPAFHCRLVHDGQFGLGPALARKICATRTNLLVWVDKPYSLAFEAIGYSAVVVLEPNQSFRSIPCVSKYGLDDGDPDFEPTALERALWQVTVPVIRLWAGPEWARRLGAQAQVIVHDYNRGRNALVRVLGKQHLSLDLKLRETSEYLARIVVGLVLHNPDELDEDEISDWLK